MMPVFDLNAVIEKLTAKVANDVSADDARAKTVVDDMDLNLSPEAAEYSDLEFIPVSHHEQISLRALVSWTAESNGLPDATIAHALCEKFGAEKIALIDQADFDQAIEWLVDFKPTIN